MVLLGTGPLLLSLLLAGVRRGFGASLYRGLLAFGTRILWGMTTAKILA